MIAITRMPLSPPVLDRMVAKIINYEKANAAEGLLLVADENDTYDFEALMEQLRPLIPGNIKVEDICRGQLGVAEAKARLLDAIARGQKIVDYTGHGSIGQWKRDLLTSTDALALSNEGRLPLFVMLTCLNGYFQDAAMDSLAESLMKAEHGGAIAVWASSGMTTPDGQAAINQKLFSLIFEKRIKGQPLTLGEAAAQAKTAAIDNDVRCTWILFGDPTTRLK